MFHYLNVSLFYVALLMLDYFNVSLLLLHYEMLYRFIIALLTLHYITALAITGSIKGTYQMKFYNELGLESVKFRLWFRKLCLFFKIIKHGLPGYLFKLIPQSNHQYNTQSNEDIATFYCRIDVFKCSYFPATIME